MQYLKVAYTSFEDIPPLWDPKIMMYMIYQQEVTPSTSKLHWQGYVEFHTKRAHNVVKKLLGNTTHFETKKGSTQSNIAYCSKIDSSIPETWRVFGVPHPDSQGSRTDIHQYHEQILSGKPMDDIILENPNAATMYKSLMVIQGAYYRKLSRALRAINVTYIWGPPGTGKSRTVYDLGNAYRPTLNHNKTFWFDGYAGEKTLWLDDISMDIVDSHHMRTLLDIYPLPIQVKGSTTYALWDKVFITSNDPPPFAEDDPLTRRIQFEVHMTEKYSKC